MAKLKFHGDLYENNNRVVNQSNASNATPSAPGTASAGSSTDYARADHTHAAQTTINGHTVGSDIPSVSASDNGKLLGVSNGALAAVTETIPSVYCTTAGSIQIKVGTCTNFHLTANSYIFVLLANDNTFNTGALHLNINNTGDKMIFINGALSDNTNYTLPAGTYIVFYDGTHYHFRTDGRIPNVGETLIVTASGNVYNNQMTIDKTFTQISDAIAAGNPVYVYINSDGNRLYSLKNFSDSTITFSSSWIAGGFPMIARYREASVHSYSPTTIFLSNNNQTIPEDLLRNVFVTYENGSYIVDMNDTIRGMFETSGVEIALHYEKETFDPEVADGDYETYWCTRKYTTTESGNDGTTITYYLLFENVQKTGNNIVIKTFLISGIEDADSTWLLTATYSENTIGGGGLPSGGTAGQVLTKNSSTDGDASWANAPAIYTSLYCTTSASNEIKNAKCTGLGDNAVLSSNTYFHITFTEANTAAKTCYLGINLTDETVVGNSKRIYINGSSTSVSNYTIRKGTYIGFYDGSYIHLRNDGLIPNSTINSRLIPSGGSSNYVLAKNSNTNYDLKWTAMPTGLPTGGSTGQVLYKTSSTNYYTGWKTLEGIPSGGTTGQVLTKSSDSNYAVQWADAGGGSDMMIVHGSRVSGGNGLIYVDLDAYFYDIASALSNGTPVAIALEGHLYTYASPLYFTDPYDYSDFRLQFKAIMLDNPCYGELVSPFYSTIVVFEEYENTVAVCGQEVSDYNQGSSIDVNFSEYIVLSLYADFNSGQDAYTMDIVGNPSAMYWLCRSNFGTQYFGPMYIPSVNLYTYDGNGDLEDGPWTLLKTQIGFNVKDIVDFYEYLLEEPALSACLTFERYMYRNNHFYRRTLDFYYVFRESRGFAGDYSETQIV